MHDTQSTSATKSQLFLNRLRRPIDPLWQALAVSIWLALPYNTLLWQALSQHLGLPQLGLCALALLAFFMALQSPLAGRRTTPVMALVSILIAAFASYFMHTYGVVIDRSMLANAMQTDWRETRDLLSWRLVLTIALLGIAPAIVLWKWPRQASSLIGWHRRLGRNALAFLTALAVCIGSVWLSAGQLIPLMREHKQIRYLINPANVLVAATQQLAGQAKKLPFMELDPHPALAHARAKQTPVLVLVVGETARADRFSLNGYARQTNPLLAREDVISFSNVRSCGTNTADSVPCMFSLVGRDVHFNRQADYENLLDVLQKSGYAVQWLDNNSGCKGVCARVPNQELFKSRDPKLCNDEGCLDEILIQDFQARIHRLAQGVAGQAKPAGVVLVLHQMGSHGPAYYKRSPAELKRFKPECTQNVLQDCSLESIGAAYDNSIVYTDYLLSRIISELKTLPSSFVTGMLYVSDHGESLGENKLYLHGMPYAIAPDQQKHIPMIWWLSDQILTWRGLTKTCIRAQKEQALTHDHISHSVLELLDVRTSAYLDQRDLFEPCESNQHLPHKMTQ